MSKQPKTTLAVCKTLTALAKQNSMRCVGAFCELLGYPNNNLNHLIGDDPHGIVDIQEGYRFFNMTDIHVLIADYERWINLYHDNQTLRKVVDEWYYWTLEEYEKDYHRPCNLKNWLMGWRPKPEDCLPYYNEQHAKDVADAHARTEQAKQELNQEVEQFNQ